MGTIADRAALLHYRTLERQRGELVRYQRHDQSEPVDFKLVPAGADIEEAGEGDVDTSSVAHHWICIARLIKEKIGRLPENGDTITRLGTDPDDSLLSETEGHEVYRVARGDNPRAWQPHGRHGGLIRFRSILTS